MTIYYRPCREYREPRVPVFSLYRSTLTYKYPFAPNPNLPDLLLLVVGLSTTTKRLHCTRCLPASQLHITEPNNSLTDYQDTR
jgi:hypothetical protein